MRKICYLALIVASLGIMMASCEKNVPPQDEPNNENPGNTDDPNKPGEPNDDAPFVIEIIEKTALSYTFNVYPKDTQMEYIYLNDTAKNLAKNNVTKDEDIPAFDLELFRREAETYGTSVEEHVRKYYITTDEVRLVEVNGIPPGDEFVVYAYGVKFVDGLPVPTTEVITVHDNTQSVEVTEHPMDIVVEVDRCTVDVTTKTNGFKGSYFTFVEKVETYFPDTTPTEEQLVEVATDIWYRSLALYLQFGYPLDVALEELVVRGTYTSTYDLMADTEYFAAAVPIDNVTGVLYAYPTVKTFRTDVVGSSDNVIDISVSDIKPRAATVTITPSNDDPYIVACFASKPFEGMTGDQIIDYYVEQFPLMPLGGEFTYTFTGLEPDTEHFIAAFGCEGGEVTTQLFRENFKTPAEVVADIKIECEILGAFDLAEVAALNDDYQYLIDDYGYKALFAYEFITTPQAAGIQYGLYVRASTEGIDDENLRLAVMENRDIKTTFKPVNFINQWGKEYVILAVARDADGNPSELYKSDPYTVTYENRGKAEDFLYWRQ